MIYRLNRAYDGMPEPQRTLSFFAFMAIVLMLPVLGTWGQVACIVIEVALTLMRIWYLGTPPR